MPFTDENPSAFQCAPITWPRRQLVGSSTALLLIFIARPSSRQGAGWLAGFATAPAMGLASPSACARARAALAASGTAVMVSLPRTAEREALAFLGVEVP